MNKVLVAVFDTEQAAFEGVSALKELHRDGDITLYASSVIVKDADGVASIRKSADHGPIGTITGLVAGGLVGLLGGPVGVAVGAYVGGFGGLMFDLFNAGVGIDFVDEVSASLTPGKAAVVADIDETWVTPVETRLGALGATTFRRRSGEVVDDELTREAQDASNELDQLRAELRQSMGNAKATVEAKIASQRQQAGGDRGSSRQGARAAAGRVRPEVGHPAGAVRGGAGAPEGAHPGSQGRAQGVPRGAPGQAPAGPRAGEAVARAHPRGARFLTKSALITGHPRCLAHLGWPFVCPRSSVGRHSLGASRLTAGLPHAPGRPRASLARSG